MASDARKLFDQNLYIYNSLSARLGSGTFGSVYKGAFISKSGQEFPAAIKIFNSRAVQESKELEGMILQGLEHPNVVRVYQTGVHDKEGYYIAMELCETTLKGFLHKHAIKKFSEREARAFFTEVCRGVKYLQSKNVVHRDIKFENILIDSNNNLKLADFGLAKLMDEASLTTTTCGSTHIMAPEIFKRQPYGKATDIWALGVVLFGMLTGDECIFKNVNRVEYEERMKHFKMITFPPDTDLSLQARDLIVKILNPDPSKRLTIDQILEHPWMVPIDEDLFASSHFINHYNQATTSEASMANEVATLVSKDMAGALVKTVNSIFSNLVKICDAVEWFKRLSTDSVSFEELYLYNTIKLFLILNKLENIDFVGTNNVSNRVPILRILDATKKDLYIDLKKKLFEEIEKTAEKLDMKGKTTSGFEDNYLQCIFSTADLIVSKDMSKAISAKDLKKLYHAFLMTFALFTKDYDQFVSDVKTSPDGLTAFAARHKLDVDSFKSKTETFINQIAVNFDQGEAAPLLNTSEMKGLYEIAFKISSVKKTYTDKVDKALKEIEIRIEKRIKELK